MKALVLTHRLDDPCYRYRIEAFLPALANLGFNVESVELRGRRTLSQIAQLLGARQADVVILQRRLLPIPQVGILRSAASRLVYDIDDALFQRPSFRRRGPRSWKRSSRFWATMHAADLVLTGNQYLERRAAGHIDPARVYVVPTCVDPNWYPLAHHERVDSQARLVWIGQLPTLKTLSLAEACLAAAGKRLPGLELRLICDRSIEISHLRVVLRPWSLATETADLAAADIGISWLPDDSFSKGKCGLKVLQYMAAGLPVVANPVGVTPEIVIPGRTGFLASTPEQWADAIALLASDPDLRRSMGAAGRQMVEEKFNVERWGPRVAALIRSLVRTPKGTCAVTAPHWPSIEENHAMKPNML